MSETIPKPLVDPNSEVKASCPPGERLLEKAREQSDRQLLSTYNNIFSERMEGGDNTKMIGRTPEQRMLVLEDLADRERQASSLAAAGMVTGPSSGPIGPVSDLEQDVLGQDVVLAFLMEEGDNDGATDAADSLRHMKSDKAFKSKFNDDGGQLYQRIHWPSSIEKIQEFDVVLDNSQNSTEGTEHYRNVFRPLARQDKLYHNLEQACKKYARQVKEDGGRYGWTPKAREPAFWVPIPAGENENPKGRVIGQIKKEQEKGKRKPRHQTKYVLASKDQLSNDMENTGKRTDRGKLQKLQNASTPSPRKRQKVTVQLTTQNDDKKSVSPAPTAKEVSFVGKDKETCNTPDVPLVVEQKTKEQLIPLIQDRFSREELLTIAFGGNPIEDVFDDRWVQNRDEEAALRIMKENNHLGCSYRDATEICMLRDPKGFGLDKDEQWVRDWKPEAEISDKETVLERAEALIRVSSRKFNAIEACREASRQLTEEEAILELLEPPSEDSEEDDESIGMLIVQHRIKKTLHWGIVMSD